MTPPYNTFVSANDDGTLTVAWLGVDEEWDYRPTGPTTFAKVAGEPAVIEGLVLDPGERISFRVDDGDVTYLHTSLRTAALEKISFLGLGIVHIATFFVIVILFVISGWWSGRWASSSASAASRTQPRVGNDGRSGWRSASHRS